MSPNETLNIIALISGGKDSLYSLLHCMRNGHRIVALANLYPSPPAQNTSAQAGQSGGATVHDDDDDDDDDGIDEEEDIDSFMYQTIGHSVIPLYEEALGIPLYRQPIVGGVVDEGRVYGYGHGHGQTDQDADREVDETESLLPLLRRIKQAHPEANAVSAGAILSTYQRTRIENVAARLGLVPLAWLWMYPFLPGPDLVRSSESGGGSGMREAGLLEDMAVVGCEARIIKVASGGLDEGFLWSDVSETGNGVRRRIVKGMRPFAGGDVQGAVLGEGGEYETLALDGPEFLWKRRIVIEETVVRKAEGGVGYLRLKRARCVDKDSGEGSVRVVDVRRPRLLDEWFGDVCEQILRSSNSLRDDGTMGVTDATARLNLEDSRLGGCDAVQTRNGGLWMMSNTAALEAGPGAAEQMDGIARKVKMTLKSSGRSTDDIVFATVLLQSMADFAVVNGVYASIFKKPNPPARATVACGHRLPKGVKVMISFVVDLGPRVLRQGLHVQSRSYWAPANIGPYSQAMSIPLQAAGRLVYVAGQIPLEPASMAIVSGFAPSNEWLHNYSLRAVLSLQHLWRIGEATEVDWWLGGLAFLSGKYCTDTKARVAWHLWEKMHTRKEEEAEEDEVPELDPWDIKYGGRADEQKSIPPGSSHLPNFAVVESGTSAPIPPFFAVQVEELPRGSEIEWQGLGCKSQRITMTAGEMDHGRQTDTIVDGDFTYTGIEIDMAPPDLVSQRLQSIISTYCKHPSVSHAVVYTASPLAGAFPGQSVPCSVVWGRGGRRIAAGITIQRNKPA